MTDIALNIIDGCYDIDINLNTGDLVGDDGLETSVSISLFTDKRVNDEQLPSGHIGKRGWWGDMYADISQDKIGSRLWTLQPAKTTNETLRRSEDYSREALQWMIEDAIADDINVISEYNTSKQLVSRVEIIKPDGLTSKFSVSWDAQEIRRI